MPSSAGPIIGAPQTGGGVVVEREDPAGGDFGGVDLAERQGGVVGEAQGGLQGGDEFFGLGEGVGARGAVAFEAGGIAPQGREAWPSASVDEGSHCRRRAQRGRGSPG